MKKASHQSDLSKVKGLQDKWLFLVYGDPLYKSEAVAVLQMYRFVLTASPDDESKTDAISALLKKALRNFDARFFRDLAEAMERLESSERRLSNHFKIMKFIVDRPASNPMYAAMLGVPKKDITYNDLKRIAPGGDIATIVRDLGLVDLGIVVKAKPGRKSRNP